MDARSTAAMGYGRHKGRIGSETIHYLFLGVDTSTKPRRQARLRTKRQDDEPSRQAVQKLGNLLGGHLVGDLLLKQPHAGLLHALVGFGEAGVQPAATLHRTEHMGVYAQVHLLAQRLRDQRDIDQVQQEAAWSCCW